MNCTRHGTPMSLVERDRSGDTWSCGQCLLETARSVSRSMLAERLEDARQRAKDGIVPVPEYMVKLVIRKLREDTLGAFCPLSDEGCTETPPCPWPCKKLKGEPHR